MAEVGLRWWRRWTPLNRTGDPDANTEVEAPDRSRPNSSKVGRNRAAQITAHTKLTAVGQQHRSSPPQKGRAESKQARIIEMLRMPSGATIAAMAQATGWQPHSVRGFLAGVIRKKLGFHVASESSESGRTYRITERTASTVVATKNSHVG